MDKLVLEGGIPLRGEVRISGAKNAALPIIAASMLLDSPSVIRNVPNLEDIAVMIQVLEHLNCAVKYEDHAVTVDPAGFTDAETPYDLVRRMRASIYALGPLLAKHGHAKVSLPGGCAIGPRPVDLHLRAMEALGATVKVSHGFIEATAQEGLRGAKCLLAGDNGPSVGGTCNVLMAATLAKGETLITGAAVEPEIGGLIDFLQAAGAWIEGKGTSTLRIRGRSRLEGVEHDVMPDRIETGTYMAAAMITRGDVLIRGTTAQHLAVETQVLRELGADIHVADDTIRVRHSGEFLPTAIRTFPYPGFATDLQAQFTAILCIANGESTITETVFPERFVHTAELCRMGAKIRLAHATAVIQGVSQLTGTHVMATDLRASAALILGGLAADGATDIHQMYHLDRGYEDIAGKLAALGAHVERMPDRDHRPPMRGPYGGWPARPNGQLEPAGHEELHC